MVPKVSGFVSELPQELSFNSQFPSIGNSSEEISEDISKAENHWLSQADAVGLLKEKPSFKKQINERISDIRRQVQLMKQAGYAPEKLRQAATEALQSMNRDFSTECQRYEQRKDETARQWKALESKTAGATLSSLTPLAPSAEKKTGAKSLQELMTQGSFLMNKTNIEGKMATAQVLSLPIKVTEKVAGVAIEGAIYTTKAVVYAKCHQTPEHEKVCSAISQSASKTGKLLANTVSPVIEPCKEFIKETGAIEKVRDVYKNFSRSNALAHTLADQYGFDLDAAKNYSKDCDLILMQTVPLPSLGIGKAFNTIKQSWRMNSVMETALKVIDTDKNLHFSDFYKKISHAIPDFTDFNHEQSVKAFTKEFGKSRFFPLDSKDSRSVLNSIDLGRSGSVVNMLQNSLGETEVVIKSFGAQRFSGEIASNIILKDLKLKNSQFPEFLMIGKHTTGGIERGVLAMNRVPGESLSTIMTEVAKFEVGSSERTKALDHLKNSSGRVAEFISELHGKTLHLKQAPADSYIDSEIKQLYKSWSSVKSRGLDQGVGDKEIKKLVEQFKKSPGHASYVHGDLHPSNFFWDSKELHSIDLQSFSRSVGSGRQPIGVAFRDFEQMRCSFDAFAHRLGLEAGEISTLKKTMETRYKDSFAGVHTEEAQRFYRYYWSLELIAHTRGDPLYVEQFKKLIELEPLK